jgi:4-hydroxyacetophenone monooxygenase
VPKGLQWLFRHVPRYAQWYRFWIFWTSSEGLLPSARVEEGWDGNPESIGEANDLMREMFAGYMRAQLADRPDLAEKVIPKYPPASKRIVLDNGIWPETLKRENVRLITDKIAEITPRGVRTEDGQEYRADVLIYATGFQASRFLTPMTVRGRNGIDLNEQWDGDARAYMGVVVPNFPNFFMTYGPNTNIVVNGSIVYFSECEITYVMSCLELLLRTGAKFFDCRQDVHDRYNEWVDRGNLGMAWGVAEVPSWYRNAKGRSAQNWPYTLLEYWQQTRAVNAEDYVLA